MLFLFISVAGCSKVTIVTDDFLNDLASEDNRIAGQLYLDVYNKNLDTLTYEAYMNYLKTNEALSAQGLFTKIQKARGHYFKSKINAFLITLFYSNENEIVCDNSGTSFIDSVYIYKSNEPIPSLKEFSDKIKF
jgi:hypothetical protein